MHPGFWKLAEKVGQGRRITDVTPGGLDGPDLLCLFVDPDMDPAPDASFGATILEAVKAAFACFATSRD